MAQHTTGMAQHPSDGERGRQRPQRGPAVEAVGLFALIMADIWWVEPRVHGAWLVLLAVVIASHARRGETPSALGFRRANLRRCLVAVAPLLLGIAALALALGLTFGTVRHVSPERLAVFVAYYCGGASSGSTRSTATS